MRVALMADVHANLHALDAVLRVLKDEKPDVRLCLGDVVGYNAHPRECIARLRDERFTIVMGNHDHDVARDLRRAGTNAIAQRVMAWTRTQLDDADLAFLGELPHVVVGASGFTAVHGCFLEDSARLVGYVTPGNLRTNLRALAAHDGWPKLGFCGHAHVPLLGWMGDDGCEETLLETTATWPAAAQSVIINPGAVGQPRDGDPRASFAIVDVRERTVRLFRVHYDIDAAVRSIADADLPDELGGRLFEAR